LFHGSAFLAAMCVREIAKERFEPEAYFDKIVWPAYCQCLNEQRAEGNDVGQPFEH